MCAMVKSRVLLGMVIPPLIGILNPYNGYINPYYWVEFPIPYYMEIMGVDRPWHMLNFRGSMFDFLSIMGKMLVPLGWYP